MQRWIIHVDMDAFFAAVEQRDNPELKGKPVIIGGLEGRGVVATCSYEARRFGVRSAMPMYEARRLCPQGVFLPGNYEKYKRVSAQFRRILSEFSPVIEPLALDEAFLDVTGMELLYPDPLLIAQAIRHRIKTELQLTASAGVAPNKFLAKLASDLHKPDGLVIIRPGEERQLLANLPIRRLWGIGEATAGALAKLGIMTIGQLAQADMHSLEQKFGKVVWEWQQLANGVDDRPVIADCQPKSLGKETTFAVDLTTSEELLTNLLALAEKVGWRLRRAGYAGRTITLKVRFSSFKTITRSRTLPESTCHDEVIYKVAKELIKEIKSGEGIRLLGITVSHLDSWQQTSLFPETDSKRQAMYAAVDRLRARFGEGIVKRGRLLKD